MEGSSWAPITASKNGVCSICLALEGESPHEPAEQFPANRHKSVTDDDSLEWRKRSNLHHEPQGLAGQVSSLGRAGLPALRLLQEPRGPVEDAVILPEESGAALLQLFC